MMVVGGGYSNICFKITMNMVFERAHFINEEGEMGRKRVLFESNFRPTELPSDTRTSEVQASPVSQNYTVLQGLVFPLSL